MKLALVLVVLSVLTVPAVAAQTAPSPAEVGPLPVPADALISSDPPNADGSCGDEAQLDLFTAAPVPQSCTTIHYSCNGWYENGTCCADGRKQLQKVCYRCYDCTTRDEPFCDLLFTFSCNGGWC